MTARMEGERCRLAMAGPCTFRLFFIVGRTIGWTVGRTFLVRITPLTILLRLEKGRFCGENTPLITIKRRGRKVAKTLYLSGFWSV